MHLSKYFFNLKNDSGLPTSRWEITQSICLFNPSSTPPQLLSQTFEYQIDALRWWRRVELIEGKHNFREEERRGDSVLIRGFLCGEGCCLPPWQQVAALQCNCTAPRLLPALHWEPSCEPQHVFWKCGQLHWKPKGGSHRGTPRNGTRI